MEAIKEFCNETRSVKYFSNDEAALKALGVEYKIFGTRDAAQDAAWNAAWNVAWDAARRAAQEAVQNATWDAARNAAWNAAWEAAWCAAWDAALNVTWNAARDAAWSAALQCCITTVRKDLDIPQEHRDYAFQDWGIWKAGYGVLGRVEDVFYIYEKP